MNDEELVSKADASPDVPTGNPLPTEETSEEASEDPHAARNTPDKQSGESEEMESNPAVFDDSVQDPDPAASASDTEDTEDRVEQLRSELNRLRTEIAARDADWKRMGQECEEFRELYPEVALSALPDAVWADVRRGIPIAAAYALNERKQALTAQKAATYNQSNALRSSGALSPTESDYFSPEAVRAMTQKEVRANYQKIMRSMQKWH